MFFPPPGTPPQQFDVVVAKTKGSGGTYVEIRNRKTPTTLLKPSTSHLMFFVNGTLDFADIEK
jgi:hypothetical protein